MRKICSLRFIRTKPWLCFFFGLLSFQNTRAQAQLQPWGNLTGISVRGELMPLETSIKVTKAGKTSFTAKESQMPAYHRIKTRQVVATRLGNIGVRETVADGGPGGATVSVVACPDNDTLVDGIFLSIRLPLSFADAGSVIGVNGKTYAIRDILYKPEQNPAVFKTKLILAKCKNRTYRFSLTSPAEISISPGAGSFTNNLEISIPVHRGLLKKEDSARLSLYVQCNGIIDTSPVHIQLDSTVRGRPFDGFGGNFRIQNLRTDPAVIGYCLNNLRVAWGRVEMPWQFWQSSQQVDPVSEARAGRLDSHVVRAMEMAKSLSDRGIPVILTAWFPPAWAIVGKPMFRHAPGQPWGNPLNQDSAEAIYRSITAYIGYLKEKYGVDIKYFSFNESDLGINIRQTAEEHAKLIRELGKYFAGHGLETKMLLGDNSDATTYAFIDAALKDSSCHRYIGAVSFHSWRGCDSANLDHWTSAARHLNAPLLVGEGSIDAAAWAYPEIFGEQVYAMEEISLYIRLLSLCQPESILQWQLTADYSPLTGAGIFGSTGPLAPTWRFWNLKQLASTPPALDFLKASVDNSSVVAAALGDSANRSITVHVVNNGPARKLVLSGIPGAARTFRVFVTSATEAMHPLKSLRAKAGKLQMLVPETSFITFIGEP